MKPFRFFLISFCMLSLLSCGKDVNNNFSDKGHMFLIRNGSNHELTLKYLNRELTVPDNSYVYIPDSLWFWQLQDGGGYCGKKDNQTGISYFCDSVTFLFDNAKKTTHRIVYDNPQQSFSPSNHNIFNPNSFIYYLNRNSDIYITEYTITEHEYLSAY